MNPVSSKVIGNDELYIQRCLDLAQLGLGNVAPNPMVGAVLVYNDRIIGEGYHQKYGEPHAEVNCIASVAPADRSLIPQCVLYVSLEPCAHHGKTPPCADLIIKNKISKVVIGCQDPFSAVNGKGIEKLQAAGIETITGVSEKECQAVNKRFFTFHTSHRPYVILKWAQSANAKIAGPAGERVHISNEFTNRLSHKWRSDESAILIGTHTALWDNPQLTTRLWSGNSPVRIVVDMDLKLPVSLNIFKDQGRIIVFNKTVHQERNRVLYYKVTGDASIVPQILDALFQLKILSVIVEGGARLLQSFINENAWDEATVITNRELFLSAGLKSPELTSCTLVKRQEVFTDSIETFKSPTNVYL